MKVKITNVTETLFDEWALRELRKYTGIIEGDIIENAYHNPTSNAVYFSSGSVHCVAWLGQTCEEVKE